MENDDLKAPIRETIKKEYILIYLDIMGFEDKIKIDANLAGIPEEILRLAYLNFVEIILNRLRNEKSIVSFVRFQGLDSWLIYSHPIGSWKIFKNIGEILKTKLNFEIAIDVVYMTSSEEEIIYLCNDSIAKIKEAKLKLIIKKYRDSCIEKPKKTFILLTSEAFKKFDYKQIYKLDNEYYLVDFKKFENLIAVSQQLSTIQKLILFDNDYISIPTNSYKYYEVNVPKESFLHCDFRSFGGNENSIQVLILDNENFVKWKNDIHVDNVFYNSGLATDDNIDILFKPGRYIIVFSNRYNDRMGDYGDTCYNKTVVTTIYLENIFDKVPQISVEKTISPIVFEKWLNNDNVELWIINSDGSGLHQLTKGFYDTDPAWSPNCQSIVFSRRGEYEKDIGIFIVDNKGNNIRKLNSGIEYVSHPQWLKEDLILFATPRGDHRYENKERWRLYTISLIDQSEKKIEIDIRGGITTPIVSPNRQLIAFFNNKDHSIYISDINWNIRRLKSPLGGIIKGNPMIWYRDNAHILIQRKYECLKADLNGIIEVEPIKIHECNLSWSPDNRWVVYQLNGDIWLSDINGENKQLLVKKSNNEILLRKPIWSDI